MSRVWFITGCSTGFGRVLCEELARKGEKVVATARKLEAIQDLSGKDCLTTTLDVTDQDTIGSAVAQAIEKFGRIDVLVNNAGYGEMGPIEEATYEIAMRQFDTNVFGVLNVQRAVLPVMRKQGGGHVLNISSIAGLASFPNYGMYCASKHALEAISEALAKEVADFGIKVTLIEPGRFRTDFAGRSLSINTNVGEAYKENILAHAERMKGIDQHQPGDPVKAVQAMIKIVDAPNPPLRLLLGPDAYEWAHEKINSVLKEFEEWKNVSISTDFDTVTA